MSDTYTAALRYAAALTLALDDPLPLGEFAAYAAARGGDVAAAWEAWLIERLAAEQQWEVS